MIDACIFNSDIGYNIILIDVEHKDRWFTISINY